MSSIRMKMSIVRRRRLEAFMREAKKRAENWPVYKRRGYLDKDRQTNRYVPKTKQEHCAMILEGQTYEVVNAWKLGTLEFRVGDSFEILSLYNNLMVTTCDERYHKENSSAVDNSGNMRWTLQYFEECRKKGYLAEVAYMTVSIHDSREPKNNGTRENCYWCGEVTEVLIGRARICRNCNK